MLISYHDITSRIHEEPKWYTYDGVPRYCEFAPDQVGIYPEYAVLAEIACQSCKQTFLVSIAYDKWCDGVEKAPEEGKYYHTIEKTDFEKICTGFHYGDPPSHGCIGDTMNCEDLKIIEAWQRNPDRYEPIPGKPGFMKYIPDVPEWVRVPEFEKDLPEFGTPEWLSARGLE